MMRPTFAAADADCGAGRILPAHGPENDSPGHTLYEDRSAGASGGCLEKRKPTEGCACAKRKKSGLQIEDGATAGLEHALYGRLGKGVSCPVSKHLLGW